MIIPTKLGQAHYRVDMSHPSARGLRIALDFADRGAKGRPLNTTNAGFNLARGNQVMNNGGASFISKTGFGFVAVNGNHPIMDPTKTLHPWTLHAPAGYCMGLVVGSFAANTLSGCSMRWVVGDTPFDEVNLEINAGVWRHRQYWDDGAGSTLTAQVSGTTAVPTGLVPQVVFAQLDPAAVQMQIWVNGVLEGTATPNPAGTPVSPYVYVNTSATCRMYYSFMWDRCLSQNEILRLTARPRDLFWQPWKARNKYLRAPASAATYAPWLQSSLRMRGAA